VGGAWPSRWLLRLRAIENLLLRKLALALVVLCSLVFSVFMQSRVTAPDRFYRIVDGNVDALTYNGYRRYHAGCNHCHGPDGTGSMFGPALVNGLPDLENFRRIVRDGQSSGASVMSLMSTTSMRTCRRAPMV
jgi:mono/diheme cytochrome c family protein